MGAFVAAGSADGLVGLVIGGGIMLVYILMVLDARKW